MGIAISSERNPKKDHTVFQTAHSEEDYNDFHHVEFEFASGEYQIQPVSVSTLNGDEFPRAWSQSVVLGS